MKDNNTNKRNKKKCKKRNPYKKGYRLFRTGIKRFKGRLIKNIGEVTNATDI